MDFQPSSPFVYIFFFSFFFFFLFVYLSICAWSLSLFLSFFLGIWDFGGVFFYFYLLSFFTLLLFYSSIDHGGCNCEALIFFGLSIPTYLLISTHIFLKFIYRHRVYIIYHIYLLPLNHIFEFIICVPRPRIRIDIFDCNCN